MECRPENLVDFSQLVNSTFYTLQVYETNIFFSNGVPFLPNLLLPKQDDDTRYFT